MIALSKMANNLLLNALSTLLDGGSIELMSDQRRLAVLTLSSPAMPASDGELVYNNIGEEDAALAQGTATSARVLSAAGDEVFFCDVGDENSDAVIKLNSTRIYRGSPIRLESFRLAFP